MECGFAAPAAGHSRAIAPRIGGLYGHSIVNLRPALLLFLAALPVSAAGPDYRELLLADKPVAYWRFNTIEECCTPNETHESLRANAGANVSLLEAGPRPPAFPGFSEENTAADFTGYERDTYLRVKDPGAQSEFDFENGDTITMEAWVQCQRIGEGKNVYIVGKGRTGSPGFPTDNQNWALRLRGQSGAACPSFVFHDREHAGEKGWHRWTTLSGIAPGKEWHHVVVSYEFGAPESIRGYVNGEEIKGAWDMGGASAAAPAVDNDEAWIGGSMGGAPQAQFPGRIDELAIYRTALSLERIKLHAAREGAIPALREAPVARATPGAKPPSKGEALPLPPAIIAAEELPKGKVRVQVFEFARVAKPEAPELASNDSTKPTPKKVDSGDVDETWSVLPEIRTDEFTEQAFAFADITNKYNERGVKVDRSGPYLVRAAGVVRLPAGEYTLHLRGLTGARVAFDGHIVADTPLKKGKGGDVEAVPDMAKLQLVPSMPVLLPGHKEVQGRLSSDGQPHVLLIECLVGGKGIRPEIGELFAAVTKDGKAFALLAPEGAERTAPGLTPGEWQTFTEEQRARVAALNAERRRNPAEEAYWKMRHDLARQSAKPAPAMPAVAADASVFNDVDRFIAAKFAKTGVKPAPLCDDASFLRRATLDLTGVIPTEQEAAAFLADNSRDKRAKAIDRLLASPGWADHWTSYWQDVLAENPNILKGTLNNTGPFRWWIHEALLDNKPMDRFVTELITMEGSAGYGGPAGFAVASQNDLPMAAKAQILSSAFLANEMKCARCHDAPYHPFEQGDLFKIAAMLQRTPLKVPGSSLTPGMNKNSKVTVTLTPGQMIDPHFPFSKPGEPLPGVLRKKDDSRENLAAILTDPRDDRFAQVVVNRLWRQFLGFGIIDPVDDWSTALASHPDLLRWLAHELITHDYDLKHVARIILNSHTYQRMPQPSAMRQVKSSERLFESQARRRMTAEQLVDSLFAVTGLPMDAEQLSFDPEDRQSPRDHNNLGTPRRAWEFTSLSNERDRPALAKPRAQVIADVLAAFGWRESRPEPRSTRDHDANVLQPATLANSTIANRLTRLSDEHAFTALALEEQPVGQLVERMFLRLLSRQPTPAETAKFSAILSPDFAKRRTGAAPAPPRPPFTMGVSWANHLNPDASTAVLAVERVVKAGPAPSPQLSSDWRDRMEDAVWALMLSPEFTYIP
jgi:hypothetical protein